MGTSQTTDVKKINKATIVYSNGEKYEGEILDYIRQGFGTYYYAKGDRYQGMWYQNMKQGRGTLFYNNEDVFEGWWNNNKKEGVGTYYYKNGEKYYGEWRDNKKNGKGIIIHPNGSKFIGQFKNNKRHGMGEYVNSTGEIYFEDWKEGKMIRKIDKHKHRDNMDYHQFNAEYFEKYLENKIQQQFDTKSSQFKSKFFTLEMAKMIRSKNPEGFYDSMKVLQNDLLYEKPDISAWGVQDLCDWFKHMGYEKYIGMILENNIDGVKFFNMEFNQVVSLLKITDKAEAAIIGKSHELFKKIKKEGEYLKSLKSIKSIKKDRERERIINETKEKNIPIVENDEHPSSDEQVEEEQTQGKLIQKFKDDESQNEDDIDQIRKLSKSDEYYSPRKFHASNVNLNGLSFYINFEELSLSKKVGEGGK